MVVSALFPVSWGVCSALVSEAAIEPESADYH